MISELNKYHGLPNGMFSCDEHLAGLDPSQGSELCTVVEYMFSLEQRSPSREMPRWATGLRNWHSMRCPARSPTTCGRTNTTRNQTRLSAACTISHGLRMGRNRISLAWSQTLAAALRTSTRAGQSLRLAFHAVRRCRTPRRTTDWLRLLMLLAKSAQCYAEQQFTWWRKPPTPSMASFGSQSIPRRRSAFRFSFGSRNGPEAQLSRSMIRRRQRRRPAPLPASSAPGVQATESKSVFP